MMAQQPRIILPSSGFYHWPPALDVSVHADTACAQEAISDPRSPIDRRQGPFRQAESSAPDSVSV